MQRKTRLAAAATTVVVLAGGAATTAVVASGAGGDDDENEAPITGDALDRASEAALAHIGEGRVTGTEVEDEESKYEVEVTKDDGSQVDVQLDEQFEIVSSEGDDDGSEDDG